MDDDIFNLLEDSLSESEEIKRPYDQEAEDDMDEFMDNVMLAADMAADSRGFFMITITIESVKGRLAYVPRLFAAFADDDVADVLQTEIVNVAHIIEEQEPRSSRLRRMLRRRRKK